MQWKNYAIEKPVGRVLFKREYGMLEAFRHDFSRARMVLSLVASIIIGFLVAVMTPMTLRMIEVIHGEPPDTEYFNIMVGGIAAMSVLLTAFFFMDCKRTTMITDMGVMYGGMFQRWEEIKCYAVNSTKNGIVVWTYSKRPFRNMRMYFRNKDSTAVQKYFSQFCGIEKPGPGDTGT